MAETPVLNQLITEEEQPATQPYQPGEKEREVVSAVFTKFRYSADERDMNFAYFDGRTLTDYINDSVQRFFTNVDVREGIEDWQARVFQPLTRNKVMAVLSRAASAIPHVDFFSVGSEDVRRTQILGDLYKYSDEIDDSEELMFYAMLEAAVKGTVVGYEGYDEKKKAVRDIKSYDSGDNIELIEGSVETRKVAGSIVPLEDFYPSSVGIRKIKHMPYCFWRTTMTDAQFKMQFAQYEKAKDVKAYFPVNDETADRPFYLDYISNTVAEGHVEIIRYYNQDTDEFIITANGVWLNPLKGDLVMPIPFIHKTLP